MKDPLTLVDGTSDNTTLFIWSGGKNETGRLEEKRTEEKQAGRF